MTLPRPTECIGTAIPAVLIAMILAITATSGIARQTARRDNARDVTILVTADPHSQRERDNLSRLKPDDFAVYEDGQKQEVVSVVPASKAPPVVEVLIQDDLVGGVANEIRGIKDFIRGLPEGSRVMTGYLSTGSLRVAEDFTTDRARAADSLRIPMGNSSASPSFLYSEVVNAIKKFEGEPDGRRVLLLISDGLDLGRGFSDANPALALDLDRAIREAQRRGVAVFTFYAPSVGPTSYSRLAANYGQGSLNRIADETGGVAFFGGMGYVTFDPFFKEMNDLLDRQWLVTYRSSTTGSDFRKIKVTTELDVNLQYPEGYKPK